MKRTLLRAVAAMLCAVLLIPFAFFSSSAAIAGDVNGDGSVTTADVTAVLKHISGMAAISKEKGDVNGDGLVNTSDATLLLKHLAGYDVTLTPPKEEDEWTEGIK